MIYPAGMIYASRRIKRIFAPMAQIDHTARVSARYIIRGGAAYIISAVRRIYHSGEARPAREM